MNHQTEGMIVPVKQFLIFYDYDNHYLTPSVAGIREAIGLFGEYVGAGDLFQKALNGVETMDDMIQMFNHFSHYSIDAVYTIDEVLYCR